MFFILASNFKYITSKITKKLGEFQKITYNVSDTDMYLEDTLKFFEIRRIFGQVVNKELLKMIVCK